MADIESANYPCETVTQPIKKLIPVGDLKLDLSELNGHSEGDHTNSEEHKNRTLSGDYGCTNGSRHTSTGEGSFYDGCQPPLSADSNGSVGERSQELMNGCNGTAFTPISDEESRTLLAKLEEANRMLEADCKSLRSLSPNPPGSPARPDVTTVGRFLDSSHSRQGSISSEVSTLSAASSSSQPDEAIPDDSWSAWRTVVDESNTKSKKKQSYIKELVRRGVPQHFRGIVWPLLSGSSDSKDVHDKYIEYMKVSSPCEKLIRRDITRTFPDHELFRSKNSKGQESLFNVMKAYSLYDVEVGYCQGSSFIVGLLLMQMPEEDAFAVLVKMMQVNRLRDLYKPSMAELGLCMFQLESMIQEQLPELCTHFHAHDFHVSMFATPWFLTLYATSLPIPLVCRIFDIFLLEGLEIVFRIGFAMLQLSSSELQSLDMEGMMRVLQKDLPARFEGDPESLFTTAFQVNYNARKMKKLEKEYNTLKSKENQDQADLRRLKTENRLLRQRIESLENETTTLADRLIHDQVKHAQTSEEVFTLRRQMSYSRQQSQENSLCKSNEDEVDRADTGGMRAIVVAKDARIAQLQQSLTEAHQREIKEKSTVQELRIRVQELENFTTSEPDNEVQGLQEQLIASKMREAESNLLVKELEQKVGELERHWQKYLEDWNTPDANRKLNKTRLQETSEDLMACRIRETNLTTEITNLKQRLMEMETSNHIFERQVKRLEGENAKLLEQQSDLEKREQELRVAVADMERQTSNLESTRREEEIMSRIKEAEHAQTVAELQQNIAELEIQNQELLTAEQLHSKSAKDDQNIERRIAELREELVRLKSLRCSRLGSTGTISYDTDSDDDYELNVNKLQLTQQVPSAADSALQSLIDDVDNDDRARMDADHTTDTADAELDRDITDHDRTLVDEFSADEIRDLTAVNEHHTASGITDGSNNGDSALNGEGLLILESTSNKNPSFINGSDKIEKPLDADVEKSVISCPAEKGNSESHESPNHSAEFDNSETPNNSCEISSRTDNAMQSISHVDSEDASSFNLGLDSCSRTLTSCSFEIGESDDRNSNNNNNFSGSKSIVNNNLNETESTSNQFESKNQPAEENGLTKLSVNPDTEPSSDEKLADIYENHAAYDSDDDCAFNSDCDKSVAVNGEITDTSKAPQREYLNNSTA